MQSTGKNLQKVIETIEISKKDEVHLKVACEASIAQEICDYFTFAVPGYTFMPAYRMKIWDGKIRLFNILFQRKIEIQRITIYTFWTR